MSIAKRFFDVVGVGVALLVMGLPLFVLALQANERRPETPEPPLVRVTDLLEFKVRGVNAAVIQR